MLRVSSFSYSGKKVYCTKVQPFFSTIQWTHCSPLAKPYQFKVELSLERKLYMEKSRFTEQQIVSILKEVEIGARVNATCRKYSGPIRQDRNQSSLSWSVRPSHSCMTLPHCC